MKVLNKIIIVFIFISIIGLFLPWFFFEKSMDYAIGWNFIEFYPNIFIGIIFSLIFIVFNDISRLLNIITLIWLLVTPISCIYVFFTWHVLNITGKIDLSVSFSTAHYGFYITFISSCISLFLYLISFNKRR